MDQINYVMRKVNLIINLQNEQISIRNTREIHEIGQIVKISISFNRLVFPANLTESQQLDTTACTESTAWPFCTKGNGPHHPYLLSTLCELTFLHQHLLCPLHPLHGGTDLFALKVMVPTTHICWVHCVSWPFCTNTYCVHCIHCVEGLTFLH